MDRWEEARAQVRSTGPCRAPGAAAAALRSGRTLVMSLVGSVIRRKRKITTQKHTTNKTQLGRAGFFFFQLCDVLVLVIIHKRNKPILATGQRGK
jgi:hypothetical protein